MLDINLLRVDKGGNPDLVRESQRKRFASVELVDEVIALDQAWRASKNLLPKPLETVLHPLLPSDPSRHCRAIRAGQDPAGAQCHQQEDRKAQSCKFRFVYLRWVPGVRYCDLVSVQTKQEEEAKKLMESTDEIKKRLAAKDAEVQEAKSTLDAKLMTIANIIHASVSISDDEVCWKF